MTDFDSTMDMNSELMLDGNAVAGLLQSIFGGEMTMSELMCVNCGRESRVGEIMVFNQSPGIVMRCPTCQAVMLRVVKTPTATLLDARGVMYLRIES